MTLLVGQQEGHPAEPVKIEWWNAGVVICLGQGADLHMALLMPLPLNISCSSNPDWFYLPDFTSPVPAHPGSHKQNPKQLCVFVCVCV